MRRATAGVCLALLMAACGGGNEAGSPATSAGASVDDLAVTAANYDLAKGTPSRFTAGLETSDRRLVTFGTVTMRFAFAGTGKGEQSEEPGPPVEARYLAIAGSEVPDPPPSTPQVVTAASARGVYAASTVFDRAGFWEVQVTAKVDGRPRRGTGAFQVLGRHQFPAPGDAAPATENLTLTAPPELRPAVDSRAAGGGEIPDPELHRSTIASALAAKRPVVAVLSTPVYCVSRFCGPVTDMVAELARSYGDRATFVHVEVWRDFQGKVVNKSAAEWVLRDGNLAEPWVYVVGADGRISARFDNVVIRGELEPLVKALPVIGPAA
ncbi:MAG: hypothetical protein ACRD0Q_11575 [Acidimicrobiales bacterium]